MTKQPRRMLIELPPRPRAILQALARHARREPRRHATVLLEWAIEMVAADMVDRPEGQQAARRQRRVPASPSAVEAWLRWRAAEDQRLEREHRSEREGNDD